MSCLCSGRRIAMSLILGPLVLAVGSPAASAAPADKDAARGNVMPGIDVLRAEGFKPLLGKRVALITNHTGLSRDAESTIDILHQAKEVDMVALFSPEHGIRGTEDSHVDSGTDDRTGLPVHSLYGKTSRPTAEMLEGIDVLVFDIQDIGTRFYTYIGTMALAMKAAQEHDMAFVVLDRPNPIGGEKVEGLIADDSVTGVPTAIYPIPTRHGMTVGELARLFNDHFGISVDLTVVPMRNWKRWMYWDDTGLVWVNPSPNMKTLNGAILYPGPGAAETTWISCGRGTARPFEMYGAPYMNSDSLASELRSKNLPGLRILPWSFTPAAGGHKHQGEPCQGIFMVITDRDRVETTRTGLHMVQAMEKLFPDDYKAFAGFKTLWGKPELWNLLTVEGLTPEEIIERYRPELEAFLELRAEYLVY